jgi:hypothetical protein
MKDNWVIKQAESVDITKGIVVLENPDTKEYLDRLLLNEFWPPIHEHLEKTGYPYSPFSPESTPKIETKLSWELARSFTIMLFEDTNRAINCVTLECRKSDWMIETEFFLGLPFNTEPRLIHEILGNSRFEGYPPTMMIYKRYPESYYDVTLHNGSGESWGLHDNKYIIDRLNRIIDVNIEMYEKTLDGILSEENVADFLSTAFEVFESF